MPILWLRRPTLATRRISFAAAFIVLNCSLAIAQQADTATINVAKPTLAGPDCAALHAGAPLGILLAALRTCQKDAIFLAQLGQQLNHEARFEQAAEHLERALMLEPDLKDAQLSYAIALTGLGDLPTAQALLDNLLQDPALPQPLRARLQQQRAATQQVRTERANGSALGVALASASAGWRVGGSVAAYLGYDSNLLGAPNLQDQTLTFAGQTLTLVLDESYRAQGGSYARAQGQFDLQRVEAGGAQWNATLALRSRSSAAVAHAGSAQLDVLIERSHTLGLRGNYLIAGATVLQLQTGSRLRANGVGAGWAGAWQGADTRACQARVGLQAQDRQYADVPVLSGRYIGYAGRVSCDSARGAYWAIDLRLGQDRAQDPVRPGGDQQQAGLGVSFFLPFASPVPDVVSLYPARPSALVLTYEYATQRDAKGYSPLLDDGRTRSVERQSARVQIQQAAGKGSQWVWAVEWLAQTSSLALFQQQSWGASLGYRVGW